MPAHRPTLAAISLALVSLAGCDAPESMRGATSLFQVMAPPDPLVAAEMAINPWDADARARGTMLLANSYFGGEDPYHALYLDRASDEDPNVRAAALRGLSLHGLPEDAPVLAAALADPNTRVRLEAARALQRVHNPEAIDALILSTRLPEPGSVERTGEPEPTIRAEATHALGQYAEPRVVQPLISALDDRFLAVNDAARDALTTLTGQDFGLNRKAWLEWYGDADAPFARRTSYIYPAFHRSKFFWEYIPFLPGPPNETASTPVGFPPALERHDTPSPG